MVESKKDRLFVSCSAAFSRRVPSMNITVSKRLTEDCLTEEKLVFNVACGVSITVGELGNCYITFNSFKRHSRVSGTFHSKNI